MGGGREGTQKRSGTTCILVNEGQNDFPFIAYDLFLSYDLYPKLNKITLHI